MRRLPSNTTYHVRMGKCLWGWPVVGFGKSGRERLSDSRMKR